MIRNILFALAATASIPAILAPQPAAAQAARTSYGADAKAVQIRTPHISVQVIGKGSPVILVPGLSSPREVWEGAVPELAKRHKIYLVQVNGFGGDDPQANLSPGIIDGLVADLHAMIASEKLGKPAVVGHSMGGLAALMLASKHPGDVGKVLIVDALPFVGSAFFPGSTIETVRPQAEAMRGQMAGLYGKPVPENILNAIAAQNAAKPESRAKVAAWSASADMRVSAQAMFEDLQTDVRGQLAMIVAPVTVLVPSTGAEGEAKLALYRGEYAGTPKLTVTPVADSGHFIMLDQPEAFQAALIAFLAR